MEESKHLEIKIEHEIRIDDNKIRIEMNNKEIIYSLIIDISFNKYIKRFSHDVFRKEFELEEVDIKEIWDEIINCIYEINTKEKKIIVNDKKKIY